MIEARSASNKKKKKKYNNNNVTKFQVMKQYTSWYGTRMCVYVYSTRKYIVLSWPCYFYD